MQNLKTTLQADLKIAMREQAVERREAIRLIMSAIKQKEVDERVEVSDADIHLILDKMAKQRRDSITQFQQANRTDLVAKEQFELSLIQSYLPAQLTAAEIETLVEAALKETSATSIKDLGKVMAILKPQMQGRADLSTISHSVKARLQ